jgi:hypothetical protein
VASTAFDGVAKLSTRAIAQADVKPTFEIDLTETDIQLKITGNYL